MSMACCAPVSPLRRRSSPSRCRFGQKDLSAAGKGFGHDLVEKLMGDSLKGVRQKIEERAGELKSAIESFNSVRGDAEDKQALEDELKDVEFNLEQFDKHGIKDKLEKRSRWPIART